jgi:PKD repeat protein
MIYKKNPREVTWNSTLSLEIATKIKEATKTVVYNNLGIWDFALSPSSDFSETVNGGQVNFTNASSHYNSLLWDFGDSNTSTENNPVHVYNDSGTYDVSLSVTKCDKVVTLTKTLNIDIELGTSEFQVENLAIFPNPAKSELNIKLNKIYREIKIQLVDSTGKILTSKTVFDQFETSLNVARFQSGIYMLKVVADEFNFTQKIVIE